MGWILTSEELPKHNRPILIDSADGVGEAYYKGKGIFRFVRFCEDVSAENVYRWAEMPPPSNLKGSV